jgi:hypothetical protein
VNVRAFRLTIEKLRQLEQSLRKEGLSARDCKAAVSAVKKWLLRDVGAPENTPRDVAVPDETTHP